MYEHQAVPPNLKAEQSSSGDEYRSVIDDLTIEIQRLKEELKRYKQLGPDMLRKEKLFEIKIHGLPNRKKRELESTLRDFAAGLEGSPGTSSSQKKKSSRRANADRMYSASESVSKDAPSSSGSNVRPADSAYASMSTGANSSGTSLIRPSMSSRLRSSEQKVENYLRDIPEGLYPRHMVMTEKEKKKLVVRRLEHLFTGKISGRHARRNMKMPPIDDSILAPIVGNGSQADRKQVVHQPPTLQTHIEPSREARILPNEQQPGHSSKKSRSRDNVSASNSYGDQTESGGNGNSSGSGTNTSPPMTAPPEQRPTRPKDLDPDRVQVPSENMDYIRHLGLVPPELLAGQNKSFQDVHPDADGWVYLNLLCNLAQLHIINVTPGFVRSAVTEMSTKFQLSPDGRKIRWRGGMENTKFASDSSGDNSHRSASTDDTDASDKQQGRKRQKTGHSTGENSGSSSKNASKLGAQASTSSESFHYKPLFVHHDSSGQTSMDDATSSFGPGEESNVGESRWGLSGSGTSNRKKRRRDGAIIYYSGAPFCTDLSGDPGDVSPTSYMFSSSQSQQKSSDFIPPPPQRSQSGSLITYKPLSEKAHFLRDKMDVDEDFSTPGLTADESDDQSELELDFTWSDDPQYIELHALEPCGLGGVLPDDHFMVVVTTKRSREDDFLQKHPSVRKTMSDETTEAIANHLARMSTSSPVPVHAQLPTRPISPQVEIEYMSGRIKRLAPVPLPPPAIFFPPFSTDASSMGEDESSTGQEEESSEGLISQRVNPHQSDGYPDGIDLSSGDEDGEDPDDSPHDHPMYAADGDEYPRILPERRRQSTARSSSAAAAAGTARGRSKSISAEVQPADGSSAATAGGVESGYSSSGEESPEL